MAPLIKSFLELLHASRALRQAEVRAQIGAENLAALQTRQVLRCLHSPIGPLVVVGPLGLRLLGRPGRPLTTVTATEFVALRDAVAEAKSRGFEVVDVESTAIRLLDMNRRHHILLVRVAHGLPSAKTVNGLIRKYRFTLMAPGNSMILYVLNGQPLKRLTMFNAQLRIWEATTNNQ